MTRGKTSKIYRIIIFSTIKIKHGMNEQNQINNVSCLNSLFSSKKKKNLYSMN
jgi:hypothetical protein